MRNSWALSRKCSRLVRLDGAELQTPLHESIVLLQGAGHVIRPLRLDDASVPDWAQVPAHRIRFLDSDGLIVLLNSFVPSDTAGIST